MKRRHLFEWEDFPWFPATLRNLMTDYLRHVIIQFKMYEPVVPVLERLLDRTKLTTIIDLASGGGGPWAALAPALLEKHPQLKVLLTDLYPNVQAMESVKNAAPDNIEVMKEPVNVLQVPNELRGLRTQFLSLHHFKPEQAKAIFQNAIKSNQPIAVFEFQERSLAQVIQFALSPLFVLLLSPFIRPFTFNRIFFTYIIPVVPICVMWDGIVSVLRTYTSSEVKAIIESIPDADTFEWDIRSEKHGQVTCFQAIGLSLQIDRLLKDNQLT